jgi:hypothetical protein
MGTLPVELFSDEITGEAHVEPGRSCERLRAANGVPVVTEGNGVCEECPVRSEMYERGADRSQPREGFEGERARFSEKHEPFEARPRAANDEGTPMRPDSILYMKPTVEHPQARAVAIGDEHARSHLQRRIRKSKVLV